MVLEKIDLVVMANSTHEESTISLRVKMGLPSRRRDANRLRRRRPLRVGRLNEAIADYRSTIAHYVRDETRCHFREIDVGVAYRRRNRFGDFAGIDNARAPQITIC